MLITYMVHNGCPWALQRGLWKWWQISEIHHSTHRLCQDCTNQPSSDILFPLISIPSGQGPPPSLTLSYFQQPTQNLAHSRHAINTCWVSFSWCGQATRLSFTLFLNPEPRAEFSHSNRDFSWTAGSTSWPCRGKTPQKGAVKPPSGRTSWEVPRRSSEIRVGAAGTLPSALQMEEAGFSQSSELSHADQA